MITKAMTLNQIVDLIADTILPSDISPEHREDYVMQWLMKANYKKSRIIVMAGMHGIYTDYGDDERFKDWQNNKMK